MQTIEWHRLESLKFKMLTLQKSISILVISCLSGLTIWLLNLVSSSLSCGKDYLKQNENDTKQNTSYQGQHFQTLSLPLLT